MYIAVKSEINEKLTCYVLEIHTINHNNK